MKSRWNGIYCASAAVAGVCLSSSVAGAGTGRTAEFETEFELPIELAAATVSAAPLAAPESPAAIAVGAAVASDCAKAAACDATKTTTVAAYLERLARRGGNVDVIPECLPETLPAASAAADSAPGTVDEGDADEEFAAFMADLIGAEPEAKPALLSSSDERCCPATEAALAVAAAVRPMLDFTPFRWLAEPVPQKAADASPVAAQAANAAQNVASAPEPSTPTSNAADEPSTSDADREEPVSFFP